VIACAVPPRFAALRARVIDEDRAHCLGGDAEEMCAALGLYRRLILEPEIRLVHQRGCLQGMASWLRAHIAPRLSPQLVVNPRKELVERRPVA
jgi:hypothetical protein